MKTTPLVLALLLCFVVTAPSEALGGNQKKYNKVTGITEYRTPPSFAHMSPWHVNQFTYRVVGLQSDEKKQAKALVVFEAIQDVPSLFDDTQLYLLLDNGKRYEIAPFKQKAVNSGGSATYWGYGYSTFKNRTITVAAYELEQELLDAIANAKRIDGSIAGYNFDMENSEMVRTKDIIAFVNAYNASQKEIQSKAGANEQKPSSP